MMRGWRRSDGGPGSARTGLLRSGGGGHREGDSLIVLKFREWVRRRVAGTGSGHAPGVVLDAHARPMRPALRPGQCRLNPDYDHPFGLQINTPEGHCAFCGERLRWASQGEDMIFTFAHPNGDKVNVMKRVHREPRRCPAVEVG